MTLQASHRLALLVVASIAGGCAGVHLHNENDAQVAVRARTAFKEAGVDKPFTGERELIADQNRRQLAAIRQFTAAHRDAEFIDIVGSGTQWESKLKKYAEDRQAGLLGGTLTPEARKELAGRIVLARERIAGTARTLAVEANSYALVRTSKDPPNRCPVAPADATRVPASAEGRVLFGTFTAACKSYVEAVTAVDDILRTALAGSKLASANQHLLQLTAERNAARAAVARAKAEYEKAVEAYREASKKPSDTAALDASLAKLQDTLELLGSASETVAKVLANQKLLGRVERLQQELASIDAILEALRSDGTPPEEGKPVDAQLAPFLEIVRLIPAIRGAIDRARTPRASALLLEAERIRFELARHTLFLRADDDRIAAAAGGRDAMLDEVVKLNQVVATLAVYGSPVESSGAGTGAVNRATAQSCRQMQANERFESAVKTPPPCGELVATALLQYADSWTYGRAPQREALLADVFIRHRTALELSENALGEWAAIIDIPLSQVVAYHESGIRSEDLANLIHALGLGAIAIRVK